MNLRISASSDITLTNRDAIARFERCVRIVNYVNAAIETGSRAESTCSVPVGLVEFSQFTYVHLIYVENVR